MSAYLSSDYSTISLLVLLALANNLMFLDGIFRDLYSDSVIYMSMARRLLEGQPEYLLHPMWQPLFPLVSAFFYMVFRDWLTAARTVSVVFGSLLVVPIYFLAKDLLGKYPAILTILLIIFLKPITIASTAPLSEALVMFCFWSGFFFLWISLKGKHLVFALVSGLFWGLAYLTKPEGMFALIGFLVFALIYIILLKKEGRKRLLKILLLSIVGFILIYSPYYAGMRFKYNKSFFSAKAAAIFNLSGGATKLNKAHTSTWAQDIWSIRTFNPKSEFLYYYGYESPKIREILIMDALTRIRIFLQRFIFAYFGFLGIILILTGLAKLFMSQRLYFFYSITVFMVMFASMSFFAPSAQERYIYWTIPFFVIAIISGIKLLASAIKKWQILLMFAFFFLFVLIENSNFMFLHIGPPGKADLSTSSVIPLISVDNWLSSNYPGSTVMAGHERVVFNNRGLLIYAPNTQNPQEFFDYARLKKVSHIVAAHGEIPAAVDYLYRDPKNYKGLVLEYSDKEYSTYIYRVLYQ